MPKFGTTGDDDGGQTRAIPGLGNYSYSAVGVDRLGASEYTLVTIAVDTSTSTRPFEPELAAMAVNSVDACKRSPRAANILVRLITFSDGVQEVHGFKPLAEIDTAAYAAKIKSHGNTALFDAAASSIGAMSDYGKELGRMDFQVNGIVFIITDGRDNVSKFTADTVRAQVAEITANEMMDSVTTILIGVNAGESRQYLEDFRSAAGIGSYLDVADATPGSLAKLAAFVSRSVSSVATSGSAAAPAAAMSI